MKKQLFWIFVALTIFVGFLVHKDPTSAQTEGFASTSPNSPAAAFGGGNLVVVQVGDGTAAPTNAANPVNVVEYTTAGTLVQTIPIPSGATSPRLTVTGNSTSESHIVRSADGKFVTLTGYDVAAGTATGFAAAGTARTIARIDASGNLDLTTALTDGGTGAVRSAASTNGTDIWQTNSAVGLRYKAFGSSGASTAVTSAPTNTRVVKIFNGQLYMTSGSANFTCVNAVGSGTPTTSGSTTVNLTGMVCSNRSPYSFSISPDGNTMYVADDSAATSNGGIQKWTQSAGAWTNVYTLLDNGTTDTAVRGLTVDWSGANPVVYATTTASTANTIISVVDTGASSTATVVATAPTNTYFRGIDFAPSSGATPTPTATATPTPTPAPVVTSVAPTSGPSTGGTSVAITGTNFTGATAVKFGATAATSFTFNSATSITAISPAGSGTVDVMVTTPGGTSATSGADQFTFTAVATPTPTPAPSVTSVSPNSGPTAGATSVIITGTNFTGASAVTFGGTNAASFSVTGPTQITATSPGHAAGTVDVVVTTSGGTSATSASDQFTYSAPTPTPSPTISPTPTPAHVQHVADFDGDGKTDFTILRDPNENTDPNGNIQWWTSPNANPNADTVVTWGLASGSDHYLTGDYDGDHKADFVVWRQPVDDVHAAFWILRSSDGTAQVVPFGLAGDTPYVVGDYDGDGKDDVAIFRTDPDSLDPTQPAEFWFQPSSGPNKGQDTRVQWGIESDFPIPGDYNGDGKADMAVGRDNGDGTVSMWIHFGDGTGNPNTSQKVVRWGLTSDFYVPGDYDGDGKTDLAIVRSNGTNLEWWIQWSSDNSVHIATWGLPSDLSNAVQGDYDGDGKTDIGIWRASDATFYVIGSATGTPIYRKWGNAASAFDSPLPFNEH